MIYKDGTITLVSGSAIAKGTGTKFKANINGVSPGATIQFQVGATVYNNSVLSVNSDTEIVLAFPAPVAGNNVNYAILTTMTESYGDGVRKMMADVTYITYFLRNMDAWMTDNGIVELDMPNGQKVTLNSIHKMQEDIDNAAKIGLSVNNAMGVKDFAMGDDKGQVTVELADGKKVTLHSTLGMMKDIEKLNGMIKSWPAFTGVLSPDGTGRIDVKTNGEVVIYDSKNSSMNSWFKDGDITTKRNIEAGNSVTGGELVVKGGEWSTVAYQPTNGVKAGIQLGAVAAKPTTFTMYADTPQGARTGSVTFRIDEGAGTCATREWIYKRGLATNDLSNVNRAPDLNKIAYTGLYGYVTPTNLPAGNSPRGNLIHLRFNSGTSENWTNLIVPNYGENFLAVQRCTASTQFVAVTVMTSNMWTVDGSGFYKKSSPIINIHPDGTYTTNDESEGATVARCDTGHYLINGIRGYNADGAWGVNGGISAPKDNNGLELIYIDDRVNEDGSIIIETFHRQHSHLPTRFQNWRLKAITEQGERVFYHEGEPCDLPEGTRLDVRVEMPEGSVWNVKQKEIEEQAAKMAEEERIKAEQAEAEKGEFGLSENDVLL